MIPQQLSISLPFPPIRKGGLQWFEPSAINPSTATSRRFTCCIDADTAEANFPIC